jgi:hypothetical protein
MSCACLVSLHEVGGLRGVLLLVLLPRRGIKSRTSPSPETEHAIA